MAHQRSSQTSWPCNRRIAWHRRAHSCTQTTVAIECRSGPGRLRMARPRSGRMCGLIRAPPGQAAARENPYRLDRSSELPQVCVKFSLRSELSRREHFDQIGRNALAMRRDGPHQPHGRADVLLPGYKPILVTPGRIAPGHAIAQRATAGHEHKQPHMIARRRPGNQARTCKRLMPSYIATADGVDLIAPGYDPIEPRPVALRLIVDCYDLECWFCHVPYPLRNSRSRAAVLGVMRWAKPAQTSSSVLGCRPSSSATGPAPRSSIMLRNLSISDFVISLRSKRPPRSNSSVMLLAPRTFRGPGVTSRIPRIAGRLDVLAADLRIVPFRSLGVDSCNFRASYARAEPLIKFLSHEAYVLGVCMTAAGCRQLENRYQALACSNV